MKMVWSVSLLGICFFVATVDAKAAADQSQSNAAPNSAVSSGSFDPKEAARELKELRSSLNEVKHNAKSLLAEFQRSDVKILEYGDFINDYLDDKPPVPYQEQLYQFGVGNFGNTGVTNVPLPPRKQWVDHFRDNVGRLVLLSKQELGDISSKLPADDASDAVNECNELMDKLSKAAEQVSALTDKSDTKQSQHMISELLDDVSHLELSSKRLVRRHITPKGLK